MAKRTAPTPGETTTERLLRAAEQAFGQHGYERARLEDMAAEAGITRASLLHHYPSKDALYDATLTRAFSELERAIERSLLREAAYDARLKALVDALLEFERDRRDLLAVILRGVLRDDDPIAAAHVSRSLVPLVDRLEAFVRFGAGKRLPRAFPVRAAILNLVLGQLVRSTMGARADELWGGGTHSWMLARALLAPEAP